MPGIGIGISPYLLGRPGGFGGSSGGPPTSSNAIVQAWLDKIGLDGYTYPSQAKVDIYTDAFDYADTESLTAEFDLLGLLKVENEDLCKIPFIHSGGASRRFILQDSPVFTSNIGLRSGAAGYLRTDYIPSTDGINFLLNDASYGAFTSSSVQTDSQIIGCLDPNGDGVYPMFNDGNLYILINSVTITGDIVATPQGLSCAVRTNATEQIAYRDGISVGGAQSANSTTLGVGEFTVLTGGFGQPVYDENCQFFFCASGSIDQAKLNTFVNMLLL